MPKNYSSITKSDKEFYQKDIDKYLSYLINPNSVKNQNDQFKIEIDYKMKIQNLEIKSLNERENHLLYSIDVARAPHISSHSKRKSCECEKMRTAQVIVSMDLIG